MRSLLKRFAFSGSRTERESAYSSDRCRRQLAYRCQSMRRKRRLLLFVLLVESHLVDDEHCLSYTTNQARIAKRSGLGFRRIKYSAETLPSWREPLV